MNYYNPSYYMSTGYPSYNNQYPVNNQLFPMMQQPAQQPPTPQPQQTQVLNGKIVDSEDVVRATEVPIGGYGIFPKADLSEIYIKSWNNNGTTSVITFRPVAPEPAKTMAQNNAELSNLLLQKIETLENKLDVLLSNPTPIPTVDKKSEVMAKNGF